MRIFGPGMSGLPPFSPWKPVEPCPGAMFPWESRSRSLPYVHCAWCCLDLFVVAPRICAMAGRMSSSMALSPMVSPLRSMRPKAGTTSCWSNPPAGSAVCLPVGCPSPISGPVPGGSSASARICFFSSQLPLKILVMKILIPLFICFLLIVPREVKKPTC